MTWTYAIPVIYGATIAVEWLVSTAIGRRYFGLADSLANIGSYVGYLLINSWNGLLMYYCYVAVHEHALFDLSFFAAGITASRFWILGALLFVLDDLTYYVFHRFSHRNPFFWASHVSHHSSQNYNLTVAIRQTWTPFVVIPFWLPLPFLGFEPLTVISFQILNLVYQFFLHTQLLDLPRPLGTILNTPGHHRVHHGSNEQYVDKNFGGVLIVWDRLFGTYEPLGEPVRYGIGRSLGSHNPAYVGLHGWIDLVKRMRGHSATVAAPQSRARERFSAALRSTQLRRRWPGQ